VTRETLDETVDRVAAALTVVPADPSFSQRLRPRLGGSAHLVWMAVAASTAVVAIAIATTLRVREPALVPLHRPIAAVAGTPPPIAPADVASPGVAPTGQVAVAARPRVAVRVAHAEHSSDESTAAMPALTAPDELAVDRLILPPLVIEPVALDSIGMDTIAVADIGGAAPKE